MMKSAFAIDGGIPRSLQTAAIAPSMLIGSVCSSATCARVQQHLDRADHLDVRAFDLELERHLKQARGARIARVEAVTESRERLAGLLPAIDDFRRRVAIRRALAHQLEARVEELHAALDVAAVIAAEAEHAGGDARAQRRARRRRVARGKRRGGRRAVIDERHQHRFHQPADAGRRTFTDAAAGRSLRRT